MKNPRHLLRLTAPAFALTLAATALLATPARAYAPITVTSSGCGQVRVVNQSSDQTVDVSIDDFNGFSQLPPGYYGETTARRTGTLTWVAITAEGTLVAKGSVIVSPCSTIPARTWEGDQNGDRKADVLGIQAGTGDLYYYRMTNTTLANGIKAGHGWSRMVHMQQVNEYPVGGGGNALIAVRDDGTIWKYRNDGYGRFSGGTQIGSGAAGADSITITGVNGAWPGVHHVLMVRGGELFMALINDKGMVEPWESLGGGWPKGTKIISARDFDGDHFGELVSIRPDGTMWVHEFDHTSMTFDKLVTLPGRRIGTGWQAMQTVASPGSLNGDQLSDLIARRSDGNLYKYLNGGGRWYEGQKIGTNWQKIRLLA